MMSVLVLAVLALAAMSTACTDSGDSSNSSRGTSPASSSGAGGAGASGGGGSGGSGGRGGGLAKPMVELTLGNATQRIDATEVTNREYDAFLAVADVRSQIPECAWNTSFVPADDWPAALTELEWPVGHVDWCDAMGYCAWAKKWLCGGVAPSSSDFNLQLDVDESAWFNACTGGNADAVYPYGDAYTASACNGADLGMAPVVVGSLPACEGGYPALFDMSGNVAEWTNTCDANPDATGACAYRGGSFASQASNLTCDDVVFDVRSLTARHLGFRCCGPGS